MIIKKGQYYDLNELQVLFAETVKSICNKEQIDLWTYSIENVQCWNDILTNQMVLVAQCADKIAGFSSLAGMNYKDLLYVHKDYQGLGLPLQASKSQRSANFKFQFAICFSPQLLI